MKSTVIIFKNFLDYISLPLIFVSVLLAVFYSVSQLKFDFAAEFLLSFFIPFFCVYYSLKSFKKATTAAFSVFSSGLIYYSVTGVSYSLLFIALLSFLCVKALSALKLYQGIVALITTAFLIAFALGLSYGYVYPLIKNLARFLAQKGALFGTVNSFYELAFSKTLSKLVYNTSFSGAVFNMNGIQSGVMNIFSGRGVAQLLSGKYLVNISLTFGVFAAMFKRLNPKQLSAFIPVCALAVIFGDTRLLCLFIIIYNPVLYIGYLFCVFAAYLMPSLLDIRIGFKENGSLFELVKYGEKWGYFLICALILGILTYFVSRLVFSRFDIMNGRYLPNHIKALVSALGGEENLLKIDGDTLLVKNPNLIDILKIDCEIRQNAVSLYQDELELIKEYFYESS